MLRSLAILVLLFAPSLALAKARPDLDKDVEAATAQFKSEVKGGDEVLENAKGYLIFPEVTKAGIGIGGEYGKGALVVKGEIQQYYSTKSASIGAQLGVETKAVLIAFMTEKALKDFENSDGWEVGVDGSITIANVGADGSINTTMRSDKPMVAYVYGKKGLMADVSLSGSKFSKLEG
ncbi:MAG: lipid-binding SYLF domain-containing protein [Bdellovibrionales bacterium]|nr:lipid-binding SYLF domain-containing protein [Bdellovibrionales bacterium]